MNEEDFKVKQLNLWKVKYTLGNNRVDVKLKHIWLEVKGQNEDIYTMLAQIIFTARPAKLRSEELPIYFGCFNKEVGAIIDNYQVQKVFTYTDIDWKQKPSNLDTKTIEIVKNILTEVKVYNLDEFGKILQELEKNHLYQPALFGGNKCKAIRWYWRGKNKGNHNFIKG